jgi:hypothetical protein
MTLHDGNPMSLFLYLQTPCHSDSARFASRAEEPVLSEAEGISV